MKTPRQSPRGAAHTPSPIDAYLARVRDDRRRTALDRLRRTIHAAAPGAVECISYGMPAFRVGGGVVAGFLATARGGSYYPFSGSTLDGLGEALEGRSRTKSALHFTVEAPLPAALVRRLVRARLAELPPVRERRRRG